MSVLSAAVVPERDPAERAGDRGGSVAARLGRLEAGRGVGVDLVERLALEQRACERLELLAVLVQPAERVAVALLDDAPRLGVDQLRVDSATAPWASGPSPSGGSTDIGPIASDMPQRPTIMRASLETCSRSPSAPVVARP